MLQIVTLGDEVLRKKAAVVPEIDHGVRDFATTMIDTMYAGKGIGLAAPQVGDLRRMFVCHVPEDKARVFINPEIIQTSFEQVDLEEGCLSIPGMYSELVRPAGVKVQAWNERGRPFTIEADGMLARVILHEIDHLNGVLFIDHLNEKKRERLLKSYRQKVRA
jgi:peptide deformylase